MSWSSLAERQRKLLTEYRALEFAGHVRTRLAKLAASKHAAQNAPHLFRKSIRTETSEVAYQYIDQPLAGLAGGIATASLTVQGLLDSRQRRLLDFTVSASGTTTTEATWVIAVHVNAKQDGAGACSHAHFHAHVGASMDEPPKVRVPLPDVAPPDLLDWVLTQVLPDWEPCPWP